MLYSIKYYKFRPFSLKKNLFNKSFIKLKKFLILLLITSQYLIASAEESFEKNLTKNKFNFVEKSSNVVNQKLNTYTLGPGDNLFINVNDIKYLSGPTKIDPDGNIYLPEIFDIKAEGLSLKELRDKLNIEFKPYVKSPDVSLNLTSYRPVRVYVQGEIKRPGFYTIKIPNNEPSSNDLSITTDLLDVESSVSSTQVDSYIPPSSFNNFIFPTVFDAIKASRGITPYSDLSNIHVIRKTYDSNGNREDYKAKINLLSMIMEGDQSQNIRIFDGDTIRIEKSESILKEQFAKARNSNLTPDFMRVYVSGNVFNPGEVIIPKGSGLNQAIAMSGGTRILSGKIEFLRFNDLGETEKSSFKYQPNARINTKRNPILMEGDIVHINDSLFSKTAKAITVLGDPILRTYGLYSIFD